MKRKRLLVPLFLVLLFSSTATFAQVSRISFSSAGGSNNGMPLSMGETFSGSGKGMGLGSIKGDTSILMNIQPIAKVSSQIEMFPNPTTNNVDIRVIGGSAVNFSVKVYDFTGRQLSSLYDLKQQTTVSLSGYPSGAYKVIVYSKEGELLFNQTIVKQ